MCPATAPRWHAQKTPPLSNRWGERPGRIRRHVWMLGSICRWPYGVPMAQIGPTLLVSWAHRSPDWSDARAAGWASSVRAVAETLVRSRIDAELDLWHLHDRSIDWTATGRPASSRIRCRANCDQPWVAGALGSTNPPTEGAGAVSEADAPKACSSGPGHVRAKAVIMLLPGTTRQRSHMTSSASTASESIPTRERAGGLAAAADRKSLMGDTATRHRGNRGGDRGWRCGRR